MVAAEITRSTRHVPHADALSRPRVAAAGALITEHAHFHRTQPAGCTEQKLDAGLAHAINGTEILLCGHCRGRPVHVPRVAVVRQSRVLTFGRHSDVRAGPRTGVRLCGGPRDQVVQCAPFVAILQLEVVRHAVHLNHDGVDGRVEVRAGEPVAAGEGHRGRR